MKHLQNGENISFKRRGVQEEDTKGLLPQTRSLKLIQDEERIYMHVGIWGYALQFMSGYVAPSAVGLSFT